MNTETASTPDYKVPTTAELGEEFSGAFERHYVCQNHTDGRFWLELDDKGEWSPCDEDSNPLQVVVAYFSTPLQLFFGDESKTSLDWSYDLQDFNVKYAPTDEQIETSETPIEVDGDGWADYPLTDADRAKIKETIECSIDANLADAEGNFLEKMGGTFLQ